MRIVLTDLKSRGEFTSEDTLARGCGSRAPGLVAAACHMPGLDEHTWEFISATIDYSVVLGSTVAQFKILSPCPGTLLDTRLASFPTDALRPSACRDVHVMERSLSN